MTGDELKKFRKQLELTQTQLAVALDRTRDMIAKYESGKHPIPSKIKQKIWDMFKDGSN
jgi:transcriptional regulator with XRE-family HTH domain